MESIKASTLTEVMLQDNSIRAPFIICTDVSRVRIRLETAGYKEIQINKLLSEQLLKHPTDERPNCVEKELKAILNYNVPVYITRFEMLFDPRYEIDILKFFCEKARIINVAIKWPGQFIDNKLTYARPEDPDYHEFDCNAYQIRIVL